MADLSLTRCPSALERLMPGRKNSHEVRVCRSVVSALWNADTAGGENIRRAFTIESARDRPCARWNKIHAHRVQLAIRVCS